MSASFPIAFKSVRHITITSGGEGVTNVYKYYIKTNSLSNTSFTAQSDDAWVKDIYWLALGV